MTRRVLLCGGPRAGDVIDLDDATSVRVPELRGDITIEDGEPVLAGRFVVHELVIHRLALFGRIVHVAIPPDVAQPIAEVLAARYLLSSAALSLLGLDPPKET